MDRFDEPFFPDGGDSSGASPEEPPEFLDADWQGVNEHEFPQAPQEKPSYTADPIRVYPREMGSVPLLPRQREVDLARHVERGKLRAENQTRRVGLVNGKQNRCADCLTSWHGTQRKVRSGGNKGKAR